MGKGVQSKAEQWNAGADTDPTNPKFWQVLK
jgi:hypothetical protein